MEALGQHLSYHKCSLYLPTNSLSLSKNPSLLLRIPLHKSYKTLRISSHYSANQYSNDSPIQSLRSLTSIFKTTTVAIATAALFFSRFGKPSLAVPISQPSVESIQLPSKTSEGTLTDDENEKNLEEYLDSHPYDVESLKSLMEVKIKAKKLLEAVDVIDRLILLEPSEKEWPLLKSHLYSYSGESELAKSGFEDILAKNPFMVEAYHGLVMAVSQSEASDELHDVLRRIEDAMEMCKKEKKKEDLRDFKLLVAQVRVTEGKYEEALKVYQELVKEDPRDFRPYLCQGIIYTLLRKKDDAEKQFEKYKRLVPSGHPYAQYFHDNVLATKIFSQMAENDQKKVAKD